MLCTTAVALLQHACEQDPAQPPTTKSQSQRLARAPTTDPRTDSRHAHRQQTRAQCHTDTTRNETNLQVSAELAYVVPGSTPFCATKPRQPAKTRCGRKGAGPWWIRRRRPFFFPHCSTHPPLASNGRCTALPHARWKPAGCVVWVQWARTPLQSPACLALFPAGYPDSASPRCENGERRPTVRGHWDASVRDGWCGAGHAQARPEHHRHRARACSRPTPCGEGVPRSPRRRITGAGFITATLANLFGQLHI